jgi:hypothetical protein
MTTNEFIRNGQFMVATKRDPYPFQDGTQSGWAILYLPSRDQNGHQDGDREEFATEAERDEAFARIPA